MVIAVALVEVSAKIRAGDPIDEPEDIGGPHWAGHVPIESRFSAPVESADLPAGVALRRRRSPRSPGVRCPDPRLRSGDMAVPHKILLSEDQLPTQWYNVVADLPSPPPPPLHPGTLAAGRPGRPGPAVPDGDHRPGGHAPSATSTSPATCSTSTSCGGRAPLFRATRPGAGARHAGAHLLQVRGRQPGRVAQAEHRRAAGVLQPPGGRHQADHRDRRRPVGLGAGLRHRAVRDGVRGLAGGRVVPPEAVPPDR